jgi:hypothetical protein
MRTHNTSAGAFVAYVVRYIFMHDTQRITAKPCGDQIAAMRFRMSDRNRDFANETACVRHRRPLMARLNFIDEFFEHRAGSGRSCEGAL